MRSGFIDISNSRIWNSGINQYNWSKITLSQRTDGLHVPSAYFLYFTSTITNPSNGTTYRWAGYPPSADYYFTTSIPYFVRNGYVTVNFSAFRYAGYEGHHWLATSSSARYDNTIVPSAYYFVFWGVELSPLHSPADRWASFPLRCLKNYNITTTSLYFVRSGDINNGHLKDSTYFSHYWGRYASKYTSNLSANGGYLEFWHDSNSTEGPVITSAGWHRYRGFPLRYPTKSKKKFRGRYILRRAELRYLQYIK